MDDDKQKRDNELINDIADGIVNAGVLDEENIRDIISRSIEKYCRDSSNPYKALYEISPDDIHEAQKKGLVRLICKKAGLNYFE